MMPVVPSPARRLTRITATTWTAAAIVCALLAVLVTYATAGFFDAEGVRFFPGRASPRVALVYLSGDMGLRAGTAPRALSVLARGHVPVFAVSTPTLFRVRRDAGFAARLLARAIAEAQARTGARRVLVVGQSFGADMAEIALARLTPHERAAVTGALLIVPGRHVYFRADPTSLVYRFAPDADGAAAIARITVPLTCVQGTEETDGSCAFATQPGASRVVLPGGHALRGDHLRINQLVGEALRAAALGTPA